MYVEIRNISITVQFSIEVKFNTSIFISNLHILQVGTNL